MPASLALSNKIHPLAKRRACEGSLRRQRAALFCGTMTKTQTTIGAGTKIVGSVETDGDLVVDGQLEGGPLRVAGRLLVGRTGAVSCGHRGCGRTRPRGFRERSKRVTWCGFTRRVGCSEVMATRVTFVSDAQLQGLLGTAVNANSGQTRDAVPQRTQSSTFAGCICHDAGARRWDSPATLARRHPRRSRCRMRPHRQLHRLRLRVRFRPCRRLDHDRCSVATSRDVPSVRRKSVGRR